MSEGFKGINFKKTVVSNGQDAPDRLTLNLAPEEVEKLIGKLSELQGSERGVKITINSRVKEGKFGQFISSYAFVDEIHAPGTDYGGGGGGYQGRPQQGNGQYSKGSFKPKAKGMSEATKTAAARTLRNDPVE